MIKEFLMSDIFKYILLGTIGCLVTIKFFWFMSKPLRDNAYCVEDKQDGD